MKNHFLNSQRENVISSNYFKEVIFIVLSLTHIY